MPHLTQNVLREDLDQSSAPKDFRNKIVAAFPVEGKKKDLILIAEDCRVFRLKEKGGGTFFEVSEMEIRDPI